MKYLISIFMLSLCVFSTPLQSQQYYKQFFPLAEQPNLDSVVIAGGNDNYIYMLTRKRQSGVTDNAYLRFYDGVGWFNSASFKYIGTASQILYHGGEYYVSGTFYQVNNVTAPTGKYYSLVRMNGKSWDTVGGSELDDTIQNTNAVCNDDGIYIINEASKKRINFFLYKKGSGFTTTFKIICNILPYDRFIVDAKGKLLIAYGGQGSSITSVNGTSVGACFQIKNGTVSTPALAGGGAVIGAAISFKDEIYYTREFGSPMLQIFNGTGSKDISANLGSKLFLGVPAFITREEIFFPGTVNGVNNSLVVLGKDSTQWADIQMGKNPIGLLYSQRLGVFSRSYKGTILQHFELGGKIAGKMFFDNDSDCEYRSSEILIANQMLKFKGARGNTFVMTDERGLYSVTSGADILSLEAVNKNFDLAPCTLLADTLKAGTFKVKDLPFHTSVGQDLEGLITGSFRARWGDTILVKVTVRNQGYNQRNGKARLVLPSGVDYVSSYPAATVNGNVLEWPISNLKPFAKTGFSIRVGINRSNLKVGQDICYQLRVDSFHNEKDTLNNYDRLCQQVVAAYDPNLKECSPSGDITYSPKAIDYVIHFQNLGSDFARNIVIIDTLSELLNLGKLDFQESSHSCKVRLDGRILTLSFNNAELDYAAHDSDASKGWASFSIGVASALKPNTSIKNKAYIYFDYNPAVVTGEAIVTLVNGSVSSVKDHVATSIIVYPNPANSILRIEHLQPVEQTLQVYNMQGMLVQTVLTEGAESMELDVRQWAAGIYFIKTGTETLRVMKID